MYTVTKNKLNSVKQRRGIAQNYEKFDPIRDIKKNPNLSDNSEVNVPKPVFQTSRKTLNYLKSQQQQQQQQTETLSPQHEELVKYMYESWRMVIAENPYDSPNSPDSTSSTSSLASDSSSSSSTNSIYYVDQPSPQLKYFQPFDLETWWGKRLFNNITKNL